MALEGLSRTDREVVRRCLAATAAGVFGDDTHSVIGLHCSEVEAVLRHWPAIEMDPNWELAVNNTLLNAWGYPLDDDVVLHSFGVARHELRRVHEDWNRSQGRPAGRPYFDNLM